MLEKLKIELMHLKKKINKAIVYILYIVMKKMFFLKISQNKFKNVSNFAFPNAFSRTI
jgi:hypothetical protein